MSGAPGSTSTSTTTRALAMKRYSILCLLFTSLSAPLFAQEKTPVLLLNAAHCLAVEKQDWLGLTRSNATTLNLGYLFDTKSYLDEKILFVVDYFDTAGHGGKVFTIFVSERSGRQIFDVQNNARFMKSKKSIGSIEFVEPPLGGTGTQEDLVAAIKRIERGPRFTVPVKDLLAPSAVTQCRSYADKK